jgi:hypothetical protein
MNKMRPETSQEQAWRQLYEMIAQLLQQFGKEDYRGRADYLVVDDNYGIHRHKVEVHNLRMLQPEIIGALKRLLIRFPQWEIIVAVDVPGTEGKWPRMGLTIRNHEIIDGLQRQYLSDEFKNLRYPGSRPGTGYD